MNLFAKTLLAAILVIIIAIALFLIVVKHGPSGVTEQQAESFVISDLMQSNSNATINIVSATPSSLESGSWNIVVSITYNGTRACPTVMVREFDYPALTMSSVLDSYTSGSIPCIVHGFSNVSSYLISLPPVAIAIATNASAEAASYTSLFGYNETHATAQYFNKLSPASTPLDMNLSNVWLVNYTASDANYSEYVVLSSMGKKLGSFSLQK
ncbi:MAG: hypothetical protein ACP5NE_00340 [Candidatus Micrarchaeia archaeon]